MFGLVIFLSILFVPQFNGLLFPKDATSLGLTFSVSYPIPEYLPDRFIILDWCFAMGYTVPGRVATVFYNIPIWPVKGKPKTRKREILEGYAQNQTLYSALYEKYNRKLTGSRRHVMDMSAGELYHSIEKIFVSFGWHETCLLRTVCDLAQHPFDDQHKNLLIEVLTFVLTPSQHKGFEEGEEIYREAYEDAELQGFLGNNCTILYPDCKKDLLGVVTKLVITSANS